MTVHIDDLELYPKREKIKRKKPKLKYSKSLQKSYKAKQRWLKEKLN